MGIRVAIDIGGGFVDLVAIDEQSGKMSWSKAQVTPQDFTQCVKNVFKLSAVDARQVRQLLHGQTVVINAILQRKGAKVGLITTKGFRDILALQRSNRRDIFNLRYHKPEPFVPRERRLEVEERTLADGRVVRDVDATQLLAAYQKLLEQGTESVAICFINSYRNPANETCALNLLRDFQSRAGQGSAPHLCISSDVSREWREYERTSTCVLNAYVMPLVAKYLQQLETDFRGLGVNGTLYVMLSGGGVASFGYAARQPIETVESGPVAGVVGALRLAEIIRERNIIALDGGSTTTKASLVEDLRPRFTTDYAVERDEFQPGYPIRVPVVDINEIGNGGGSIAWIDEAGQLKVGPVNAGAYPGPACYGWGGTEPTLTDAFVAAGFLNPDNFLGGTFKLKPQLAEDAISKIARRFAISSDEAAFAIVRIGNDNAAQLLRLISVQRGFDPRDFTLMAYGGSGPMMAPFLAEELEIPKVVIPGIPPGNFSAWGLLISDLRHAVVQTLVQRLDGVESAKALAGVWEALEREIRQIFGEEGISEGILLERAVDLRYHGQEHTIRVPFPDGAMTEDTIHRVRASFSQHHRREYGFDLPSAVELVNLHLSGTVRVGKAQPGRETTPAKTLAEALAGERLVYWGSDGRMSTPIYQRDRLPLAAQLAGPAVIEEPSTTIVVPKQFRARVDELGNIFMERK
jgi:N-methylhydantoinase A